MCGGEGGGGEDMHTGVARSSLSHNAHPKGQVPLRCAISVLLWRVHRCLYIYISCSALVLVLDNIHKTCIAH